MRCQLSQEPHTLPRLALSTQQLHLPPLHKCLQHLPQHRPGQLPKLYTFVSLVPTRLILTLAMMEGCGGWERTDRWSQRGHHR